MIQIDKANAQRAERVCEAGCGEQVLHVATMAWSFTDDHFACARAKEGRCRAGDHGGMRVDRRIGGVLDEIRFKKDRLAARVHGELSKTATDHICQISAVVWRVEESDG